MQLDAYDLPSPQYSEAALCGARIEIQSLREILKEKESELFEEKNEVNQLQKAKGRQHLARKSLESDHPEEALQQLHGKIQELNTELDNRQRLGMFTKLGATSRLPVRRDFEEALRYAYARSQQIRCRQNITLSPSLKQYPSLQKLVIEAFGLKEGEDSEERATLLMRKLSQQAIIRALTAAAIRDWVFETSFPHEEAEACRMLRYYRDCIFQQG